MDTVYIFLQHYWWFIISLLGALLVFLLFVQGGQGMLYLIGRTDTERNLIVRRRVLRIVSAVLQHEFRRRVLRVDVDPVGFRNPGGSL